MHTPTTLPSGERRPAPAALTGIPTEILLRIAPHAKTFPRRPSFLVQSDRGCIASSPTTSFGIRCQMSSSEVYCGWHQQGLQMKIRRELTVASKSMDAEALVSVLRTFSPPGGEWTYLEQESARYRDDLGQPACMIARAGSDKPCRPCIALAATNDRRALTLATVVIRTMTGIDEQKRIDEHNLVTEQFATDVKRWSARVGNHVRVKLGRTDIGLEQLISSPKARGLFRRYLDHHSAPHPSDIELLYRFILVFDSYSRKPMALGDLERYLQEDCLWSPAEAQECAVCIKHGLGVLRLTHPHRRS